MKKALKITGIVLLVLIVAAFATPFLFKGKILSLVKTGINKNVNATVDFKDLSLSLFRHFPKLSVALENVSVIGIDEFAKDTLVSAEKIDASVNIMSVITGSEIKVGGVYLESPRIHALVNKNGKANWDIAKADTAQSSSTDTSSSSFKMQLQQYAIKNGYIYYNDESSNMSAEIAGLDHEGSGDFTQDVFTLATKTSTASASFNYGGVPYLVNAKTNIGADIKIDNKTNRYDFKTDDILVNNLKLSANGFFQLVNDSAYNMDISFKSPSNDFKDILSLIPAVYKQDFDKIKTSGKAAVSGFVKGTYSPQQLPAYDVNLGVTDGFFQYPDLPKPVKNIQLALHAVNPDGKPDNTVVDISKGHIEMDNEPFDFRLLFKNPETAKYIDATAKGKINLADISKFVKLADTRLGGTVNADAFAKGNLSALQQQQGAFTAGGFLDIQNLFYSSKDFPQPIQNGNMKIQLENNGGVADKTSVNISAAHIEVGKDPVDFTLQLRNPVSSVDFSGTAKGRFTLDNIKQFVQLEPGTAISGILNADLSFSGNKTAIDKKEYDKINTSGTAELSDVKYTAKDYPGGITVTETRLSFNPKNVTLNSFSGNYLKTNFTASGTLNNLLGYALKDQVLDGTVNVSADKMNLNEWMGTDTAAATTESATNAQPFLVPANLNFTINAKAGQVKYDKVDYNNIAGTLLIKDEKVTLQNVRTEALDGSIAFNGSYSTRANKKQPDISLTYDVQNVDVQKTFYAFNTVQKLMPIGQFLSGKLSSKLTMTGNLKGDMMPDLKTLTGNGDLLLLQGALKKFGPLEKLASTLQIDQLKDITVKDIKNYIEFANGKVLVKPFTVKVQDIEMQIGGMHGFDQSLDYIVQLKVPRKYLGSQANTLINNLATQASGKGIPVNLGDIVNLNVKMGGTLTNPSLKTDLKEAAGNVTEQLKEQAADFVKAKLDSAKQKTKDSLTAIKNQVAEAAKEELKNQIFGKKDSTASSGKPLDSVKNKSEEAIKNTINSLFKKKKPATDTTKQ